MISDVFQEMLFEFEILSVGNPNLNQQMLHFNILPVFVLQRDRSGPSVYQESDGIHSQVGIMSFVFSAGCDN
jgi:hypothetical protein